jgi:endonuclease/exonuclease/phosphatase family metal-dependent hydrolase
MELKTRDACTDSRPYGGGSFVCKCPFSILTFNVYPGPPVPYTASDLYPNRIAAQIEALRSIDADIVCLQELYCHKSFLELQRAFPDYNVIRDPGTEELDCRGHPRRRRTANASILGLVAVLLYIGVIFSSWLRPALLPFAAAVALWSGALLLLPQHSGLLAWLSNRGTGLAIMVRRKRASIVDHNVVLFTSQAGDPLNIVAPRGYTCTILALDKSCKCGVCCVIVYNTHLNALGSPKHRATQARQMAESISRAPHGRTVVCGDFNETPVWKSGVRECLEGDGPHDANLMIADPANQPPYCPNSNELARKGCFSKQACLDRIYFKPGLEHGLVPTDQARVVFTEAPHISDHYGVFAKFH